MGTNSSTSRTARRIDGIIAADDPEVRTTRVTSRDGLSASETYDTGPIGPVMSPERTSGTTPTTGAHRSQACGSVAIICPTADPSGQSIAASVALTTMALGAFSSRSPESSRRPSMASMPSAAKKPGSTICIGALTDSWGSTGAERKLMGAVGACVRRGSQPVSPAASTPGSAPTLCTSRSYSVRATWIDSTRSSGGDSSMVIRSSGSNPSGTPRRLSTVVTSNVAETNKRVASADCSATSPLCMRFPESGATLKPERCVRRKWAIGTPFSTSQAKADTQSEKTNTAGESTELLTTTACSTKSPAIHWPPKAALASPTPSASTVSTKPSTSSWETIRARPAPREARIASSFRRSIARPSNKFPTLSAVTSMSSAVPASSNRSGVEIMRRCASSALVTLAAPAAHPSG